MAGSLRHPSVFSTTGKSIRCFEFVTIGKTWAQTENATIVHNVRMLPIDSVGNELAGNEVPC